ncbi:hypothetical protein KFE25_006847 [Diacronema lutheri]|uniref:Uncharacterized protein n=1 Tax=Diacronema lutheri TaxID=2081491 RepID=A0A8J6CFA1_DIALT|nr:hypothetical protein KFE25_006847 [Diacronema lutheri]
MVSCGGGAINKDTPKKSKAFTRPRSVNKKRQLRVQKAVAATSIAARGISKKKQRLLAKRKGKDGDAKGGDAMAD